MCARLRDSSRPIAFCLVLARVVFRLCNRLRRWYVRAGWGRRVGRVVRDRVV